MIVSLLYVPLSAQNLNRAIEYNNYIIDVQSEIIAKSLEYMSFSVHSENYQVIEKKRLELLNDIDEGIRKINRMPSFDGNNKLKNETLDVFYLYRKVYQTDLLEMLSLKRKYRDSYTALEAYLQAEAEMDIKLNKAVEQLAKAQARFAKQHDLKVVSGGGLDEVEQHVSDIQQLSTYTRLVFLEYFEVSWKFNDMIEVLPERNHRLLGRKREDVLKAAEASLNELRQMKRFKNETEYIQQTIDLVEYFQSLARREFRRIEQIFAKDAMTQGDAEYINRVFNDYNANIEVLVYNWNQANQFLWKEHIPQIN